MENMDTDVRVKRADEFLVEKNFYYIIQLKLAIAVGY